jgi:hypothetical protein
MNKQLIEEAAKEYANSLNPKDMGGTAKRLAELDFFQGAEWALSQQPKDIESLREEFKNWYKNNLYTYDVEVFDWFLPHLQSKAENKNFEKLKAEFIDAWVNKEPNEKEAKFVWLWFEDLIQSKADLTENSFDWDCIFNNWQIEFFSKKDGEYKKQDFIEFLKQNYKAVSIKAEQPKESDAVDFYKWVKDNYEDNGDLTFCSFKEIAMIIDAGFRHRPTLFNLEQLYQEYLK